jgi:hypothetical protein
MSIPGFSSYKRREFCRDISCPIQLELDKLAEGSSEYNRVREICQNACKHTAYEFHHWLINKGYLIVKPE